MRRSFFCVVKKLLLMQKIVSPITAVLMLIIVALFAFIGSFFARKLLKKHFVKAGMV